MDGAISPILETKAERRVSVYTLSELDALALGLGMDLDGELAMR